MTRLVQEPRIGCFSLAFMLAMATPRLASAQPDAVLVKTIDISGSGSGPRMRMGDLNGDGRLDILLVQSTNDNPSYVAMLTAYDGYTGKRLWQVGADSGVEGTDRDEPAQIYDIDNDGNNEVLAAMDGEMRIYNGADGTLKMSFALPDASAHDAIIIANFSKNPVPQDIVVKDRFSQAWALDKDGKLLWTYSGITGHYPWPYDADGDGRDELFIGYNQLDYLGKPKHASPINLDHPDAIWLGDIDGDPGNGFEVLYGLSRKPSTHKVSRNRRWGARATDRDWGKKAPTTQEQRQGIMQPHPQPLSRRERGAGRCAERRRRMWSRTRAGWWRISWLGRRSTTKPAAASQASRRRSRRGLGK